MAVSTIRAHVSRALSFFVKDDIFFAIGKSSPWDETEGGEEKPDVEDRDLTDLLELIGYKKAEKVYMVVPDDTNGTIDYENSKWRVVPADQAYAEKARFVYIQTTIRYDELPLGWYRQVGVYTGVKRKDTVSSSKDNLLPSEVKAGSTLEIFDNRGPSNRQKDQKEVLEIVVEF